MLVLRSFGVKTLRRIQALARQAGWALPKQWTPLCSSPFLPEGPVASGSAVSWDKEPFLGVAGTCSCWGQWGVGTAPDLLRDPWDGGPAPTWPLPRCPVPRRAAGHHAHLPSPEAILHPELHAGREADVSEEGRGATRVRLFRVSAAGSGLLFSRPRGCEVAHVLCSSQGGD